MPSIVNRVGVIGDLGKEAGGGGPETGQTPIEIKAVANRRAASDRKIKRVHKKK